MVYIERRSIALFVVLTIITCGIFGYYWLYLLARDKNNVSGDPGALSPGLVVLFSIITCGIFLMYWSYTAGDLIDKIRVRQGYPSGYKAILYLILSIVGLAVITLALLQNDFNEMVD